MTLVRIDLRVPGPDGDGAGPGGTLEWRPSVRRHLRDPDRVVLPAPFGVRLTGGRVDVRVDPTGPGWAWVVVERVTGGAPGVRHVLVPDVEQVGYGDLVEVDPATLVPVGPPPGDAWAEALAQATAQATQDAQGSATGAQGAAATAQGAAATAQGAAATAVGAASEAAGSATTATAQAGSATTARTAAQSARDEAESARDAARAARDATEQTVVAGLAWSGTVDLTGLAAGPVMVHATLTGDTTLILPDPSEVRAFTVTLVLTQDATGSRALTLPDGVRAAYGVDLLCSMTGEATDVVHLLWTGAWWLAVMAAPGVA